MRSRNAILAALLSLSPCLLSAQSLCRPAVTAYSIAINIQPTDTNGDQKPDVIAARVRASDFIARADDICKGNKPLKFGLRKLGSGTSMPSDTTLLYFCDELGQQAVEVWVMDGNGRVNQTVTYVLVQDNTGVCGQSPKAPDGAADILAPQLVVFNGLAGSLRAIGTPQPRLRVPANTLVRAVYDNTKGPFQYRVRKSGWGAGVPDDTYVTFNCDELGIQLVDVWVGDTSGNWAFCTTYLSVQDVENQCGDPNVVPAPLGCNPDLTPPDLLLHHGLANSLGDANGFFQRFYAKDFIRLGTDKCQPFIYYRITREAETPNPGPKPPKTAKDVVTFGCSELGTQLVYIWLGDNAGKWTKVLTYALAEANVNPCGPNGYVAETGSPLQADERTDPAPGAPKETRLQVQPNPASSTFTVSASLHITGLLSVYVYDCYGRLVKTATESAWHDAGDFRQNISRDDLPPGLYRCVLRTADGIHSAAILLQ